MPESNIPELTPSAEELVAAAPPGSSLQGFSRSRNGLRYELVVVQQPSRARMCGFGDKDRRPLSPTLIAKLLIYDAASGRELHPSEVNTSLFFVTSDLVHPDHLTLGPRNVLIHHGGTLPGAFGQQSGPLPSPSGDESVVSAVLDTASPPPANVHFDPNTQTHVYSATDITPQPFLSVEQPGQTGGASNQAWGQLGPTAGGFLPAPAYPMTDMMSSDPGSSKQTQNFVSYQSSSQDESMPYPIATGMAGAFHADQPQTPSSAGFPPQIGNMASGAGQGSGTSLSSFDYTSRPSIQASMGPHSGAIAATAPALGQQPSGTPTSSQPQTFPVGAVYPPTTALSAVTMTQTLSSDNLTRNLVGSAVANANVLKDLDNRVCIFFVLQDISVRTEGIYRIKLMFADLGLNGTVNRGISEALAETYTDAFIVYSPRRFPGMHDPPELSRKLVSQGVKIPVRSDRKKRSRTRTGESSIGGPTGSSSADGGGGWGGAEVSAGSGVAAADDDADDDDEDDD